MELLCTISQAHKRLAAKSAGESRFVLIIALSKIITTNLPRWTHNWLAEVNNICESNQNKTGTKCYVRFAIKNKTKLEGLSRDRRQQKHNVPSPSVGR